MLYPCPFGTHSNPYHLEVSTYNVGGRWKCWACDLAGDIFDLHAALNGLDVKKGFSLTVESLYQALGISCRTAKETRRKRPRRASQSQARQMTIPPQATVPAAPVFLTDDDAAALDECRRRLAGDRNLATELLGELGLPYSLATVCTDKGLGFPLLGATYDCRLIYLYTATDEAGAIRYTGAKLRRKSGHRNPRLRLAGGRWQESGTMNPPPDNPNGGARFLSVAGKCVEPWGMTVARMKRSAIITESETDALAILEAMEHCRQAYQSDEDPDTGRPYETPEGTLEAMIPAVVAIPGAGNFLAGWHELFRGKNVILALDADAAGRAGAEKIRAKLAGLAAIRDWTPPPPFKDAREMLTTAGAISLYQDIFRTTNQTGQ